MQNDTFEFIDKAIKGDKQALQSILISVQDMIYNLCKKSMFAQRPLSFEYYGEDINAGFIPNTEDLLQGVDEGILAEELKLSCTNVMLQCLDAESRCIYVLGIMFRADSKVCGEILGITSGIYVTLHTIASVSPINADVAGAVTCTLPLRIQAL